MNLATVLWVGAAAAGVGVAAKFMPSIMSIAGFTYPNAKFNAIGAPYIEKKGLAPLVNSDTLDQFMGNVAGRDFSLEGDTVTEVQRSIDGSLAAAVHMAQKDSPEGVAPFYKAYLQKLDARPVKEAVKAVMRNETPGERQAHSKWGAMLLQALGKADREQMLKALSAHGMHEVREHVADDASPAAVEYAVDRFLIGRLRDVELPKPTRHTRDVYVKRLVDVMNLKAIFRAKYYHVEDIEIMLFGEGRELAGWTLEHMLKIDSIPEIVSLLDGTAYIDALRNAMPRYEEQGVPALEMALDVQLLHIVADLARDDSMGLGAGIRFVVEKEYEARNLKAIAKGVAEGLPAETIWDMVVMA
ncbi:MAG: V-type ATPase subunit [Candidatus Thermoplasmatota archaeon]|nr:V-type ATPase subunit [Candidatus Thermoplasmatota archaeon]